MQVDRVKFLQALSHVKPGLSTKDRVDQSSSVVFTDGQLVTYNEQLMIMCPFDADFSGAVRAEELLGILNKLSAEIIDISAGDGQVLIKAGRSRSGIRFEEEVRLPIDEILAAYDAVKEAGMLEMTDDMLSAFQRARFCASQSMNNPRLTGLHVKGGVVTATDNYRIIRVNLKAKAAKKLPEFILPASCVEALSRYAITRMGVCDSWAFFADDSGLLFCVRLIAMDEPFPDVAPFFEVDGPELPLPTGLVDAIDKTDVFTRSLPHETDKMVSVTVKPGRVVLRGKGAFGWYEESVAAKEYTGEPIRFFAHPEFLRAIIPQVQQATLGDKVALFVGDDFEHVFALCSSPEED